MRNARPARRPAHLALALLLILALVPALPAAAAAAAAPAAGLGAWNAKVLPFPVSDVAYDAPRGKVLVTVPSTQPWLGNELVELDPATGAVGRHLFVGSEPNLIALTDDGTTAYVNLGGAYRIARVDLATLTLLGSFPITVDRTEGAGSVADLETVPGRNDTVLASRGSYNHYGVDVYRNGVLLPDRAPQDAWARRIVVADATTVYGYNEQSSSAGFTTFTLDDTGLHLVASGPTAIAGYADIEMAGGLVYATSGIVLDPVTRQAAGSFPVRGLPHVDLAGNRVTFLHEDSESDYRFSVFDRTTGAPLESRLFEGLTTTGFGQPWSRRAMVATGAGFAVGTNRGAVLFGPSVGGAPVTLPPAPKSSVAMLQATTTGLHSEDIVYDGTRHLLYLSVPEVLDYTPHRLVAVHPTTGQVVRTLVLPSKPGALALSDDRSRLHVAVRLVNELSQGPRVLEVDLATFTVVQVAQLGTPEEWYLDIEDIAVMPGTTDTVAVTAGPCCTRWSVSVYKAGVRLPLKTPSSPPIRRLTAGDGSTLYGHEYDGDFVKVNVGDAGATRTEVHENLGPGFDEDLELVDGLVYSDHGGIIDPVRAEPVARLAGSGPIEVVPAAGRVFMYEDASSWGRLVEYDLARHRYIAGRLFPSHYGWPKRMVSTGSGFAVTFEGSGGLAGMLLLHPPGAPTISHIGPTTTDSGGGQSVAIYGSGFTGATAVSFGGVPAESFKVDGGEVMSAVSPPHVAGTVQVKVTTPTGTTVSSPGATFTYWAKTPDVRYVTPSSGPAGGGTTVMLQGSGLRGTTRVAFGGVAASFTVVSDYQVQAVTPAAAAGEVPVVVTTTGGTSAGPSAPRFTYAPGMASLAPARLLETRTAAGQVGYSGARPVAGQVVELQVAGRGGMPASGVGAVVLNVTATDAAGPGFVTAWPCGSPWPGTSTLNLERAGHTVANAAVVGLGPNGKVCLVASTAVHLIADVTGWSSTGSGLSPVPPGRLLETRAAAGQVGYAGAKPAAGQVVQLQVTGRSGLPASGVGGVVLNVTATEAAAGGYVTAWPCGSPRPGTSTLNLERPGHTVANLAVVGVGPAGTVCLYASAGTHLIADVTAWSPVGSGISTVQPLRLLETRAAAGQVGYAGSKPVAGQVVQVQVAGRGGVPASGAGTVVLNVTATDATGGGYVTAWPCGSARPGTSTLNLERSGQTVANLAVVGVGAAGTVCLYTSAGTHLIADVTGWSAR